MIVVLKYLNVTWITMKKRPNSRSPPKIVGLSKYSDI